MCHDRHCNPCATYIKHLLTHQGSYGIPVEGLKQAVETASPLLVKMIRREATKPLEDRIADLDGQHRQAREEVDSLTASNRRLIDDLHDVEDDLADSRKDYNALRERMAGNPTRRESERVWGSHQQDPDDKPPSKRVKGKGWASPLPPLPNCHLAKVRRRRWSLIDHRNHPANTRT
jgi:hypothetical protein